MVFVKEDAVVMLTTGVTATAWMLSVLANTAVSTGHMATLIP